MDIYNDENEYRADHVPMLQKVVDMFEGKPDFQRIVRLGILANMGYNFEYDSTGMEDYDTLVHSTNRSDSYGFAGNRGSSSSPQHFPHYEGATNASGGFLGASREVEKAEKKRLKRQKRKERKRNEKQEKEKQTMDKIKEEEDENKPANEKSKPAGKEQAAAKDTDSSVDAAKDTDSSVESEDHFSDDDLSGCEELDMTSTFVSKARSKLEQKPKPEREKRTPAKEHKTNPQKPNRVAETEEKDSSHPSSHTIEENIRISTELANIGNTFANSGNFKMAVQYYTDAIKHNPTEYKLFGNRSFCFERMRLYMKALDDAELSLGMRPGWVKGLFRKGRALVGLKRYEEAERAFRQVLAVDNSRSDANQELIRVQIAQLREYGYTSQESAHALNTHKSVKNALHFLTNSNHQPVNLSSASSLKPHGKPAVQDKPSGQNNPQQKELYPVWVGNLFLAVTESLLEQLFSKVGPVCSVKLLTQKCCAFVNFTKQEDCEQAIRRFHGFNFNGTQIVVRYPDRIPSGMGISTSALTSDDLQEDYTKRDAAGSRRDALLYRSTSKH